MGDPMDDATAADAVPLAHAARFVSADPEQNRARFYELRLQPTLWGGVALVRAWGRLGAPGRARVIEYPDRAALPVAERMVRRRRRRGYRLVGARWVPRAAGPLDTIGGR
jgi:predicted DNA-binding WGR domain protein